MVYVKQNNKISWYQTLKYHITGTQERKPIRGSAMKNMPNGKKRTAYVLDFRNKQY